MFNAAARDDVALVINACLSFCEYEVTIIRLIFIVPFNVITAGVGAAVGE